MKRLRNLTVACIAAGAATAVLLVLELSAYSQNPGGKTAQPQTAAPASSTTADATPLNPSNRTVIAVPADAAPDRVVTALLEAIRRGDKQSAVSLLSSEARKKYQAAGFDIALPGSPQAKFSVREVGYGAAGENGGGIAHVLTDWNQADRLDRPQTHEVTWILRKEPDGWRIVESAMSFPPGSEPLRAYYENDPFAAQRTVASFQESINGPVVQQRPTIDKIVGTERAIGPAHGTLSVKKENPPTTTQKIFQIKYAHATDLARGIEEMYKSRPNEVFAGSDKSNKLVIRAAPEEMKKIEELIAELDIPMPNRPTTPPASNAAAKQSTATKPAAETLRFGTERAPQDTIPNGQSTFRTEDPPTTTIKVLSLSNAPALDIANSLKEVFKTVTIVPEIVSNSIVLRGSAEELTAIEALALRLDEGAKSQAKKIEELQSTSRLQLAESRAGERVVSALVDGVVAEVFVKTGDDVKAGQELVKLKNPELEMQLKQHSADIAAADAKARQLQSLYESGNVQIDQPLAAKAVLENLQLQNKLDEQKLQLLTVKSPIDGKVVTHNLREKLIERPVAKGESLLIIAMKGIPPTPVSQWPNTFNLTSPPAPQGTNTPYLRDAAPLAPPSYSGKTVVKQSDSSFQKAEQKASKLAVEYHDLTKQTNPAIFNAGNNLKFKVNVPVDGNDKKLEELKTEIRCEVEIAFKARQQAQTAELEALRKRLSQIETSINNREKNREAIINRRVEELINPDVKWDAGATAPQSGNVLRANTPPQNPASATRPPAGIRQVPVVTAREVDTPEGKKTVYEQSTREEVIFGEPPKSTATSPTDSSPAKIPYSDSDAIQGKWKSEASVAAGKFENSVELMEFTKEVLTIHSDEDSPDKCFYKLDPSKSPKWIDLSNLDGRSIQGIYQIEGDELKICWPIDDTAKRPAAFESAPKSANYFVILKREKPARPVEPQNTSRPAVR